jgi:hypothetical protein
MGHSMGAIVLNEIIRRYGEDLPISNIVYLAAACSIRDYQDTVWPYLKSRQRENQQEMFLKSKLVAQWTHCASDDTTCASGNPPRDFYQRRPQVFHLMLHPQAEAQDNIPKIWSILNPFPRGSLLVWLDGFLMNPATPLDLTLGRFTNLMRTADFTPKTLRSQISFTVFKNGEESYTPQHHEGFAEDIKLWNPDCWKPTMWETDPQQCWNGSASSGQAFCSAE